MSTDPTAPQTFAVGDLVTADPVSFPSAGSTVYRIEKAPRSAREVNYIAKPKDNPTGRGLKGPAFCFKAYDPDAATVETVEYVPTPEAGVPVRVNGIPKINPADLYVVLGYSRQPNAVKLVKFGGDGGRYWPTVPVAALTIVDASKVTIGE